MIWLDVLASLIIAGIFTAVIISISGRRRDDAWPGGPFYFTILFLGIWAVRVWLNPVVWTSWGWHLLMLAAIGLLLTLALLATTAPRRAGFGGFVPRPDPDAGTSREDLVMGAEAARVDVEVAQYSYGLMFWLLVIALIGAIIAGMITPAR